MHQLQYVDPAVSKAKFEREIEEFRALGDVHGKKGWFLVHAEFPKAMVVLAAAKTAPPVLVTGVLFDYSNYDAAPPSVRLVHPLTGEPYKAAQLPTTLNRALPGQEMILPGAAGGEQRVMIQSPNQALMQAYGPEEMPFLCLAGVLEYHTHPAHSGDLWELHRTSGAGRIVRLLDIIARYGVEPITSLRVELKPQISLNFGQAPE